MSATDNRQYQTVLTSTLEDCQQCFEHSFEHVRFRRTDEQRIHFRIVTDDLVASGRFKRLDDEKTHLHCLVNDMDQQFLYEIDQLLLVVGYGAFIGSVLFVIIDLFLLTNIVSIIGYIGLILSLFLILQVKLSQEGSVFDEEQEVSDVVTAFYAHLQQSLNDLESGGDHDDK